MSDKPRLPIAVFLSGSGRTLANLIHHRDQHGLPIDIRLVISSRRDVRGVDIAREDGIETLVIRERDYPDANGYSAAMFAPLAERGVEYVVMAGFLKHVLIPDAFENRVLNIHPSLLPAFGGQGMYGHHVHEAVLARGVRITGCTVHYVDNEYDNGPILHQRSCPVLDGDTPDALAARVFEQECLALPEAISMLPRNRVAG
ncbi:phosphoribosylglycinamide formyltransferase-1 [Rhodopirellula rubra]|uniref:Phosphoribosylglycinamide formyltransferase n=1 Tax=Aporhodopirellula rubra TaxID=980271 RepID=A0A7W5H894_9BACT|nr:phosphoribosylglycinamide formyltransferase [Aporhodopirellula rubra]MBB3208761.1 phosphoribosylglycinamide formyltransferase-1 [Aporhodopirellula rubra]